MTVKQQSDKPAVSVLLATRDRASLLEKTLASMERQDLPRDQWEVVVVDNGSTDETQRIVENFASRMHLVSLHESERGKCRALNRGLEQVRGELIVFTDDDVIPDETWLRCLLEATRRWPNDSVFGGCIQPDLPAGAPAWMTEPGFRYSPLAFSQYAPQMDEGPTKRRPFGPNFAVRRSALGGTRFCETLGPGTDCPMGDESEFLRRLSTEGHRLIYVPSARVKHVIQSQEMTLLALRERAFHYARAEMRLEPPPLGRTFWGIGLYLWREAAVACLRYPTAMLGGVLSRWESRMALSRIYGKMREYKSEYKRLKREGRWDAEKAARHFDPQCLHIAFLAETFPVRTHTFVQRKMEYLLRAGHDVHVFCTGSDEKLESFSRWRKRIHRLQSSGTVGGILSVAIDLCTAVVRGQIGPRQLWRLLRRVKRQGGARARALRILTALRGKRWDIIHAHFLTSLDLIDSVRDLIDCPVVASAYGQEATVTRYQPGKEAHLRDQLRGVDGLTYSSRFLQEGLADLVPTGVEQVILNPEVEKDIFRSRLRKSVQGPVRLLSVGRLHWSKGLVYALSAVRILLDRGIGCNYRIFGEGPAKTELEYATRELGLQGIARLEGAASTKEVAEAMDWADILVAPSVKEEFGVVLVEAQSAGLPVVATRVGGIPEAAREGMTSLLVEARMPQELALAIERLVREPELFRSFSQNGPKLAEELDAPRIGSQLVEFYVATIRNWPKVYDVAPTTIRHERPSGRRATSLAESEFGPKRVSVPVSGPE